MLRPYRVEDVSAVFAAVTESIDTVGRWLPWCHARYTEAESIAWIEKCHAMWQSGESYEFGMFDLAHEYVGGAGLHQLDRFHNMAALGYWVRQSRQNCGLATAAVRALVRFGFGTVGLTRIEIVAASENGASRRVAEKVGAQFECIARNRLVIHGVPVAAAVHSFVPSAGR
jgi:ribosomal-protein-serine acetyltransferase